MRSLASLYGLFIGFLGGVIFFLSPVTQFRKPVSSIALYQTTPAIKDIPSGFPVYGKLSWSQNSDITAPKPVDTTSYIIPLKRAGRLFAIEATIDGVSGNLIFDSGASNLVLNRTYFRDHVKLEEVTTSGITGSVSQADKVTAGEVSLGRLNFEHQPAHLADLGHIENNRGIKVIGLFGFQLIRSYEIVFDVAGNRLILNPIDKKGNLLDSGYRFKSDYTTGVEIADNVVFVHAMVGDKSLRFCFDTGAETNALSTDLHKSVLQTVSITHTVKLKGAGPASREVIYGMMNDFRYGDSKIKNMETILTYLDHLNDAFGVHVDGVLGFDFISKGNFCINFVKETMGISYLNPPEK